MVVSYVGYYLCRSNLSATMLLITKDLVGRGFNGAMVRSWLGWAVSLGIIGYAIGKFATGSLTDLLGGRRNYLTKIASAVVRTVLLAISGSLPLLSLT
jgi:sugar phosphate permease